ncbi:MAG: STAS domain-containing protein [Halanaerobiales bacterium]
MLKVDIKIENHTVFIQLDEVLDFQNSIKFKEKALEIIFDSKVDMKTMIIDFDRVNYIDSSGLGKLLLLNKKMEDKNGKFIIKNVNNEYIRRMFNLIHIDSVLKIE